MHKFLGILIVALFVVSGCGTGNNSAAPLPTRTPLPTFTPTPPVVATPVDPSAAATAQAEVAQPPAVQEPSADQPAGDQPAAAPTDTPQPPTPAPSSPSVVINTNMNVRGGPGTNYNAIGQATQGTRYDVTGKNQAGNWYQINFNGQSGWVFADLVTAQGVESVAVAANIPAPPPTAVPAPVQPTNTPVPAQPTAPPAPRYEFRAVVQSCTRQPAGNYLEGTVYKNQQPVNGYQIVFSYAPDGPWVTEPQTSGPHEGYTNWNPGYYSHIISATPIAGTWYVWLVDGSGARISEMGSFTTTGPGEACNQAVVDFDSR